MSRVWPYVAAFGLVSCLWPTAFAISQEKDDLALFQGEWKIVQIEVRGRNNILYKKNKKVVFHIVRFKDNRFLLGGEDSGLISLDPSKSPKHLDLIYNGTSLGIYKFDGDALLICWGGQKSKRPTEFKTYETEPDERLLTLKRIPKK